MAEPERPSVQETPGKEPKIEYGAAGFVQIVGPTAIKYSELNDLYWVKEYGIMQYLSRFKTENIIKFTNVAFGKVEHPKSKKIEMCMKATMAAHKNVLYDIKLFRDHQIIQVMLDLLSGVKFMHGVNVWHRDLKPGNTLYTADDRCVIIDFSHATRRQIADVWPTDRVVTEGYRAPEVFDMEDSELNLYDEKIDVWSLGVIFYEVCVRTYDVFSEKFKQEHNNSIYQFIKSADFKTKLRTMYDQKTNMLQHADVYFKFIDKLLDLDPKTRISATDAYDIISRFAVDMDIPFIVPQNGEIINFIDMAASKKFSDIFLLESSYRTEMFADRSFMTTVPEEKIEYLAEMPAVELITKCREQIANNGFRACTRYVEYFLLKYLIGKNIITADNYMSYSYAVALYISFYLYDRMQVSVDYICYSKSLPESVTTDSVTDAMIDILMRASEIFIY